MFAAASIVLGVFAVAVAAASLELRARWHRQVLEREGDVLAAVAAMHDSLLAEEAAGLSGLEDGRALEVALHSSKLRGVVAVRLFDGRGVFLDAVPVGVEEGVLPVDDIRALRDGRPVVRLHRVYPLDRLVLSAEEGLRVPLLEITVPLAVPSGMAGDGARLQFWMDGAVISRELARGDRHILVQALAGFGVGGALILGSLVWAFRRLARANRLLRDRAADLARANRELAQTARTAALGAITAHLVHGVRSPFAGLEDMVAAGAVGHGAPDDEEWRAALESTHRIRALLDEVQAILSDVGDGTYYEITAAELAAGLRERLGALAARSDVRLEVQVSAARVVLGAREAGLGGLVLANLVQNAIEASPAGGVVEVESTETESGRVAFSVRDQGGGLPPEIASDPFRVRRSTKPAGAGIGLAISHELARHAGGTIALVRTGASGTEFCLSLPGVPARTPTSSQP